jgi:hypothetical protein
MPRKQHVVGDQATPCLLKGEQILQVIRKDNENQSQSYKMPQRVIGRSLGF